MPPAVFGRFILTCLAPKGYEERLNFGQGPNSMAVSTTHPVYAWEVPPTPRSAPVIDLDPDPSEAERLAARDAWRVLPSSKPVGGAMEPLSTKWFEYLESKRYRRHGRWAPALLEFNRHARESLLAVGDGLGIDWVKYAEGGADVSIVDPSAERLRLYKTHFAARNVNGQFLQAPFDHLPSADARVDVVCAVFNEPPAVPWKTALEEAFRVLRPGGKAIIALPSQYNAAQWQKLLMPWRNWLFTVERPVPGRFTACELREAFAAFTDVRVFKRHLRRGELPYTWRWIFLPLAEKLIGRFLIVKAFKPLKSPGTNLRVAA